MDHLEQFCYKLERVEPDETDTENPGDKNQQSQVIRSAALSHTKLKIFRISMLLIVQQTNWHPRLHPVKLKTR